MSWHSDAWRDSYDAWKTRGPDEPGYCAACAQCGADVESWEPIYKTVLCDDCAEVAEVNSLHADADDYGEEIFDFWDSEVAT